MSKSVTVRCECCRCSPKPECPEGTFPFETGRDEDDCPIYVCCVNPDECSEGYQRKQIDTYEDGCPVYVCCPNPPECSGGETPVVDGIDSDGCDIYRCCNDPPSCGFVDPEGDPCQLFGKRVTTTIVDVQESINVGCDPSTFTYIYVEENSSIYSETITTEICGEPTTTDQSGTSNSSFEGGSCNPDGSKGPIITGFYCTSTLTNDGWVGFLNGETINSPCIAGDSGTTTVTYSDPIERCCDGYAPIGPNCECVYIGG